MLDLIDIRRTLHRIPERGYEESETSDKLFEIISEVTHDRTDVAVERHRTAILVHVPGEDPNRTIGWRADMDGLPTTEQTGLEFASTHDGLMHACGHDIHMTCGLGILERVLAKKPKHNLVILFQPAEECSGAKAVYESGVLDTVDEFYGLHVSPQWEPGTVATRPGALCPSAMQVVVEFTGKPGHPGMPHHAVDPIVAVADFVLQIQTMVSRNFDPASGGVVLTFDTITGGTGGTASPSARVAGTLRVLTKDQHDLVFRRIREIAHGVASSYGAIVDVQLNDASHPPVADDETVTRKFVDYALARRDVKLAEAPVTMTSDDFGAIVDHIPGMMFWLGVGGENPLHSSTFAPSEDVIGPTVALVGEYLLQA
jgi:N-acetyldiaminopimelate deacetylase